MTRMYQLQTYLDKPLTLIAVYVGGYGCARMYGQAERNRQGY